MTQPDRRSFKAFIIPFLLLIALAPFVYAGGKTVYASLFKVQANGTGVTWTDGAGIAYVSTANGLVVTDGTASHGNLTASLLTTANLAATDADIGGTLDVTGATTLGSTASVGGTLDVGPSQIHLGASLGTPQASIGVVTTSTLIQDATAWTFEDYDDGQEVLILDRSGTVDARITNPHGVVGFNSDVDVGTKVLYFSSGGIGSHDVGLKSLGLRTLAVRNQDDSGYAALLAVEVSQVDSAGNKLSSFSNTSPQGLHQGSNQTISWSNSATAAFSAKDTSVFRGSAGYVYLGDGDAAGADGSLAALDAAFGGTLDVTGATTLAYVNLGSATEAVASGDLAAHTAASGGLFYDASARSLTLGTTAGTATLLIPGTGTNTLQLGSANASGDNSVCIGNASTTSGGTDVAIGASASSTAGIGNVSIGYQAASTGGWNLSIGRQANSSGSFAMALGGQANSPYARSIVLGYQGTSTATGQFVVGSPAGQVTSMHIGEGVSSTTPQALTISGTYTATTETDVAGSSITLQPGPGTGAASASTIIFKASVPTGSGTTQHTLATIATVTSQGFTAAVDVRVGSHTLAATDSGAVYTDLDTGAQQQFNLPAAVKGLIYTFVVEDSATGIQVVADTGDTIRVAGSVTSSGGNIVSSAVGDTVVLVALDGDKWFATSSHGTWTFN